MLEEDPKHARPLSVQTINYLEAWQNFLDYFPSDEKLPSFPIWAMEFGATYPYIGRSPHSTDYSGLDRWRGSFGRPLRGLPPDEVKAALPPYTRDRVDVFPDWKIDFIRKNRNFYRRHREIIIPWLPSILSFAPSFQKTRMELQGVRAEHLETRHPVSCVRNSREAPDHRAFPSRHDHEPSSSHRLGASLYDPTRVQPPAELASLQYLPDAKGAAFKALGNAVNVDVVEAIARALLPVSTSAPIEKIARPKMTHNWAAPQPTDALAHVG